MGETFTRLSGDATWAAGSLPRGWNPNPGGPALLPPLHQAVPFLPQKRKCLLNKCHDQTAEQNKVPVAGRGPRPCEESFVLRPSWCGSRSAWGSPSPRNTDSGTVLGGSPWEPALCSPLPGPPQPLTSLPAKCCRTSAWFGELAPARAGGRRGSRRVP